MKKIVALAMLACALLGFLVYQLGTSARPSALIVEPQATTPRPSSPLLVGGFYLGMSVQEALDLINTTHAHAFPRPVIAFDECEDPSVLDGINRNPGRYRNPYLKGQAPWTNLSVKPIRIEQVDAYRLATEENFTPREGVTRYLVYFEKCFGAGSQIFSAAYRPTFLPDGERAVNDNVGSQFFTAPSGTITGLYFSAQVAAGVLQIGNVAPDKIRDAIFEQLDSRAFSPGTVRDPFGESLNALIHVGADGARLSLLPDGGILLF